MMPFTDHRQTAPRAQTRLTGIELFRARLAKIESERNFRLDSIARENNNRSNREYRAQLKEQLRETDDLISIFEMEGTNGD